MTKYTYKILDVEHHQSTQMAEEELQKLGEEGWYLAGVISLRDVGAEVTRFWFVKANNGK